MAEYRFLLVQSIGKWNEFPGTDATGKPLNHVVLDVPAARGSWNWGLNRAGTAEITIHDDQMRVAQSQATVPAGLKSGVAVPLPPGSMTLWIQRNDKMIWAGMVIDYNLSSEADGITITAEEFTGYYDRLRLTTDMAYQFDSDSAMFSTFLSLLSKEGDKALRMTAKLVSLTSATWNVFDPPAIPSYTYFQPALIDQNPAIWYARDNHKIGDLIRSAQGVRLGFEWMQIIEMNPTQRGASWSLQYSNGQYSGGTAGITETGTVGFTANFGIGWPKFGVDRSNPTVEWGEGTANTIKKADVTYSVRQSGTRVKVTGYGSDTQQLYALATSKSSPPAGYIEPSGGPQELNMPYFDVVYANDRLVSQDMVNQKAKYLIDRIGGPTLTVKADVTPSENFPLESTFLGDRLYTRIVKGGLDVSAWLRVGSISMSMDYYGQETVSYELSADTESFT